MEISREVAKAVWEQFQLPVFLYESTATAPNRVSLPDIRKVNMKEWQKIKTT